MCFIKVEWHIHHMKTAAGLKEKQIIKAVSHTKAFARDRLMAFKCFPRVFVHVWHWGLKSCKHFCTYTIFVQYTLKNTAWSPRLHSPSRWALYEKQMQIVTSENAPAPCRHGAVLPRCRHGDSGASGDEVISRWASYGRWQTLIHLSVTGTNTPTDTNTHEQEHKATISMYTGQERNLSVCLSSVAVNNSLFPCDITSLSR